MIVADSSATPGSAGGFDVILENAPNSTQDVTVGGFNFDILLANTAMVTLKGIDSNTASTYIFASTGSFGFLGNVLGGGIEVTGNDLAIPPLNGVTLSPGQSFGLAHVSYQVAANAVGGTVPVPLAAIGSGTALSDENGGSIADFSTRAGAISILAPVPEPSSMLLFGDRVSCHPPQYPKDADLPVRRFQSRLLSEILDTSSRVARRASDS